MTEAAKNLWYVYESTTRAANLSPDAYPVPAFCKSETAKKFHGTNDYSQAVTFLAAVVDANAVDQMPDDVRADYDEAVSRNVSKGDFLKNPMRLKADR